MCDLAYAVAVISWAPTLVLAWRTGYFWPLSPRRFDESVQRAQRVSLRTVAAAILFGLSVTVVAIALVGFGSC
jgi:hypothetical protein